MTLHGHIHNGKIVLEAPVALPAGTPVEVEIQIPRSPTQKESRPTPTLLERLGDVVGAIDDLPTDGARNLEHYLYGTPKQ